MAKQVKGARKKKKERIVSDLVSSLKNCKAVGLVDLRTLPDKQFQSMRKKLRGKATFVVVKNNLIKKALQGAAKGEKLIEELKGPSALILTDMDPFDLFKTVKKGKGKAYAKPGQIAPADIIVPAGETTLPPGPALSELKSAGIDARIMGGKVVVGKDSTVAKHGEKVSPNAAKALRTLGIEPFEVGMTVSAIWEDGTLYPLAVLDVDEAKLLSDLAQAASSAMNLSVNAAYPTSGNAKVLLAKGSREARAVAFEAGVFAKGVVEMLLAKANAQASALSAKQG